MITKGYKNLRLVIFSAPRGYIKFHHFFHKLNNFFNHFLKMKPLAAQYIDMCTKVPFIEEGKRERKTVNCCLKKDTKCSMMFKLYLKCNESKYYVSMSFLSVSMLFFWTASTSFSREEKRFFFEEKATGIIEIQSKKHELKKQFRCNGMSRHGINSTTHSFLPLMYRKCWFNIIKKSISENVIFIPIFIIFFAFVSSLKCRNLWA